MTPFTLISGASSGIGAALAIFLSQNRRIVLLGRDENKLESIKQACYKPELHLTLCVNLSTERDVLYEKLCTFIKENDMVIDSFIHAAGVTKILPLKNVSLNAIDEIFSVNLFSAIEILKSLLKRCNKKALRNVIFVSAIWSIRGDIGNSIYASSKGALNSLVFSLAKELAPNTRVNSVLPGAILTPMTEKLLLNEKVRLDIESDYPLGIGRIDDVVNYIDFLLSKNARWITGQNIVIDGGRSVK